MSQLHTDALPLAIPPLSVYLNPAGVCHWELTTEVTPPFERLSATSPLRRRTHLIWWSPFSLKAPLSRLLLMPGNLFVQEGWYEQRCQLPLSGPTLLQPRCLVRTLQGGQWVKVSCQHVGQSQRERETCSKWDYCNQLHSLPSAFHLCWRQ